MTTTPDIDGATIAIGDEASGVVLLVIDDPETGARTFDLEPVGAADVIDEGVAAIRLDRDLAAKLAAELFELLTDR